MLQCTPQTISNWVATGILGGHSKNGRLLIDSKTITDNLDTAREAARTEAMVKKLVEENEALVKTLEDQIRETKAALRMWNKGMVITKDAFCSVVLAYKSLMNDIEYRVLRALIEYNEIEAVAAAFRLSPTRVVQIAAKAVKKIGDARQYDDMVNEIKRLHATIEKRDDVIKSNVVGGNIPVLDNPFLGKKLRDCMLSVRSINCLQYACIYNVADLVSLRRADVLKYRNIGKKSLYELDDFIMANGLEWGMDIPTYLHSDEYRNNETRQQTRRR